MQSNKRMNSLEFFNSEQYLIKLQQKGSKESNKIIKEFTKRSAEFLQKKEFKLQERLEKIANEQQFPSKIVNNPRTLEQFNNDQARFLAMKEEGIQRRKEEQEAQETFTAIPEITKKSRELMKNDDKDVYSRLFAERAKKKKISILNPESERKEKKKRTKEEILRSVNGLYKDAQERNERLQNKCKELTDEANHKNLLITKNSTLVLLKNFITDFNNTSQLNFNSPMNIDLEQYTTILAGLDFIKHQNDENKINKEKEDTVINDSWKILEGSRENNDGNVDTNQLFVFCACILGLYNGENESNENIFKSVLPEYDFSKYYYPNKVAKQIKILFRYFSENRNSTLLERKKTKRLEKTIKKQEKEKDKNKTLWTSNKHKIPADIYRRKIMNEVEGELGSGKQDPNQHKVYLHDAFEIRRKKKER
jgi:hypothetical protein